MVKAPALGAGDCEFEPRHPDLNNIMKTEENIEKGTYSDLIENQYLISQKLELKFINSKIGIGVFTKEKIQKDEIIEISPVIRLDWRIKYIHEPQISRYVFLEGNCHCEECKHHGPPAFLPGGYLMFYNGHSKEYNADWSLNTFKNFMEIKANKNISSGEQILIDYGEGYFKWYSSNNIFKQDDILK